MNKMHLLGKDNESFQPLRESSVIALNNLFSAAFVKLVKCYFQMGVAHIIDCVLIGLNILTHIVT